MNNLIEQQWRDVPGYEGHYQVSNAGGVRSLKGGTVKPMKPTVIKRGHLMVQLSIDGHPRGKLVHRLVLEAFVGPCPPGKECLHRNGNPADNRLSNLHWGTSSENAKDRVAHGRDVGARKAHCKRGHPLFGENLRREAGGSRVCKTCKSLHGKNYQPRLPGENSSLTPEQWQEVVSLRTEGVTYRELSERFGVSTTTLIKNFKLFAGLAPEVEAASVRASKANRGGTSPMPEAIRNELLELRRSGWTYKALAAKFDISTAGAHYIYKNGL